MIQARKTLLCLMVLLSAACVLCPDQVYAAGVGITTTRAKDFWDAQNSVVLNFGLIPKVVALLAYAAGTFFSASGLLKLKEWISDNDRNSINPALFRLGAGAFMICLPWILVIATASLFGYEGNSLQTVNVDSAPGTLSPFCRRTACR